jgi:hypothetical protein
MGATYDDRRKRFVNVGDIDENKLSMTLRGRGATRLPHSVVKR